MIKISKLTDYATVLLIAMTDQSELLSAAQLASRAQLELPTAAKLLKLLSKAKLVEALRGAHGGYRLTKSAELIPIADVIRAIEGPIGLTECSAHVGLCGHEPHCAVRGNWRKISHAIETALQAVTLADMQAPTRNWRPRVSVERDAILPLTVKA
jgi:FeS assembly SUF system regulator